MSLQPDVHIASYSDEQLAELYPSQLKLRLVFVIQLPNRF
jgi:hypothetical protein